MPVAPARLARSAWARVPRVRRDEAAAAPRGLRGVRPVATRTCSRSTSISSPVGRMQRSWMPTTRSSRRARSSCSSDRHCAAYVVTAEHAARRYESLGVDKPWVVIPQGVNLAAATPALRERAARRKRDGEVVLGWMAAHLLTNGDRDADNPLYNVDHLLELWDEIHARVPNARLWLVGSPSDRLRERLQGRADVELIGRLAARGRACDRVVLRRRSLRAHGRPGHPRGEGLGVHRARRADGLVRLRGDGEPPRDGRRTARARCARVRRRSRAPADRRRGARRARGGGAAGRRATSTGTCSRDGSRPRCSTASCPARQSAGVRGARRRTRA